jgi:hypothetical protein
MRIRAAVLGAVLIIGGLWLRFNVRFWFFGGAFGPEEERTTEAFADIANIAILLGGLLVCWWFVTLPEPPTPAQRTTDN